MALNSISDYGGFYNNYKVVDIPRVDFDTVKEADEVKKVQEAEAPVVALPEAINENRVEELPDTRTKSADLDNISLTFNKGDDFSFIGSDFKLEDLDMEKVISDMKQDSILQDYQYFVGSNDPTNTTFENEDGKVFLKL